MSFQFAFSDVRYIGDKMILVGRLESGVLRCGDNIAVRTSDGQTFRGKISSINIGPKKRPTMEISAVDSPPLMAIVIGAHPVHKNVAVPGAATA